MKKIIFTLCAALLSVSSANVSSAIDETNDDLLFGEDQSNLAKLNNQFQAFINDSMKSVNNRLNFSLKRIYDLSMKLKDKALNISKSAYEEITNAQKRASTEAQEALNVQTDGKDVSKCSAMLQGFNNAGILALVEASTCVNDVIEQAEDLSRKITESAGNVFDNLNNLRTETQLCVSDVHGFQASAKAILCVNKATAKGALYVSKEVPAFLENTSKLSMKVPNLLPELETCATSRAIKSVTSNSKRIGKRIKDCVVSSIKPSSSTGGNRIDTPSEAVTPKDHTK